MGKQRIVFYGLLLFLLAFIQSTVAKGLLLSLPEAVSYALNHHLLLQSATIDKNLRLQELKLLQRQFDPEVFLNASATVQKEDYFNGNFEEKKVHTFPSLRMKTSVGTVIELFTEQNLGYEQGQRKSGTALRVVIEQPLLRGRARRVNTWVIDDAEIMNEIESLLLRQMLDQVIYQVIVQYRALQVAKNNIALHDQWLDQAKKFYQNVDAKIASGRQPVCDLPSAKFQVNSARVRQRQADSEYQQLLRKFLSLINWEEAEIPSILEDSENSADAIKAKCVDKNNYSRHLADNDIQLKILQLNHKRLQQQLALVKDHQLIDLKLRGEWTTGRYHIYGLDAGIESSDNSVINFPFIHQSGNYAAHLLMSVPLTGKEQRYQKVLEAKMALVKLDNEYLHYQKELKNREQDLLDQLTLKEQQCILAQESLNLAQMNYDNALIKLDADRVSMFEMNMLREKYYEAQIAFDATRIAYFNCLAHLDLSVGDLAKRWTMSAK